jgi:hypothetical protein
MNEQIKKLYIQTSNETADGNEWAIGGLHNAERFAELIVEECRNVVTEVYHNTPLELCGPLLTVDEEIMNHFYGVKE